MLFCMFLLCIPVYTGPCSYAQPVSCTPHAWFQALAAYLTDVLIFDKQEHG